MASLTVRNGKSPFQEKHSSKIEIDRAQRGSPSSVEWRGPGNCLNAIIIYYLVRLIFLHYSGTELWDNDDHNYLKGEPPLSTKQHCREHMKSTNETWIWKKAEWQFETDGIWGFGGYDSTILGAHFWQDETFSPKLLIVLLVGKVLKGVALVSGNLLFRILDIQKEIRMIQIGWFLSK